ncbi:E3 ubiquitin/ISG15 ligase TRIM25-like [Xyrauchen texanus]|uniref:E3 ubiquitin/ISG15 ligase TRIM25-like n=1 Tax=Xyrauchen texanus TaxID=154827 RepID=UPI002242B537|nr:E3 ubiquitin/ISG15 ligase TRIM25-like [Xyrauchen texanus]
MAQIRKAEGSQLEVILTCTVCEEIFKDPHQLECGHSFCMQCIEGMLEHGQPSPMFNCPECRAALKWPLFLQKCDALNKITQFFKKKDSSVVPCDFCPNGQKRSAVKTCLKCDASLCKEHLRPHKERRTLQEHPLIDPHDDLAKFTCRLHTELVMKYCPTTKQFVCHVCNMEKEQCIKIVKWSENLENKLKKVADMQFEEMKRKLTHSVDTVRKLTGDTEKIVGKMEQMSLMSKSIADFYQTSIIGALLFTILILCFYAYSYSSESQSMSSTVQIQQTQLHKLHMRISDSQCFVPPEDIDRSSDQVRSVASFMNKNSANPLLQVSPDLQSVERVTDKLSLLPHPSRFDELPQILTMPCFSYGKHHWELEVKGAWDIAVAFHSISRKGKSGAFGDNKKSWCLTQNKMGDLFVYHNNMKREVSKTLRRDRVTVGIDFVKGTITFSEDGNSLLHRFGSAQLTEPVCLGFALKYVKPQSKITLLRSW